MNLQVGNFTAEYISLQHLICETFHGWEQNVPPLHKDINPEKNMEMASWREILHQGQRENLSFSSQLPPVSFLFSGLFFSTVSPFLIFHHSEEALPFV